MVRISLRHVLMVFTLALVVAASVLVFAVAPVPVDPGEPGPYMSDAQWQEYQNSFKTFYFHLPIAITAYLSFTVVFISSIMYLRIGGRTGTDPQKQFKARAWDARAISAAEVGVVFAALTLLSGSLWAKSAWGVYWLWDVRLTTSLVLFLIYLSYLLVRQAVEEPEKRARLSAVFGILGFVGVPLSFLSIRLWRAHHPLVIGGGGGGIHGEDVILTLMVNFAAYVLLAFTLILLRSDTERLRDEVEQLKQQKGV